VSAFVKHVKMSVIVCDNNKAHRLTAVRLC